ncbi:TPA: hypothetical protein RPW15_001860 [Campylobacter fetus subsp. venerealis]|uniref:Uncharacterized protein n=1 Tax=Campylobacter fetus subsp. venerealis NCTC 10354 TaxID=983328 RepID=A0AAE6MA48_CAMFE|nr:hypothetical protein [Campylobacter fetus]OCS29072.1 hypothetical protein CFVCCUG33900_08195 [Campylobacter fetus subsp. venerealis LMG 6570 = CCUG 33900]AIR80158.1 hypothetical protein CFV97608_0495 [Campylobacter fetus subsp. venerealis 97/608]EAK0836201.1 hypothetical protein [Campylobacter fetus]MBK3487634.1 hypothetical protein [Campylobacter fetus subsp. venerealis]OCS26524.1 hypothetical protein CFV33872_09020 [Campylobacter fetus subsp. venerealis CCUG 33872]
MLVKIGKTETKIHDKSLENAVNEFAYLKQKIDSLNDELKAFKEIIINKASEQLLGSDSLSVSFESMNENKVKVSFGWDVKVSNPDTLAVLLGDKFDLLVKSEMTYKAEKRLKELALNDDGLKECLEIKEKAPSVSLI